MMVEIVVEIAVKATVKPGWHSILYNRPPQRQTKRPWCSIFKLFSSSILFTGVSYSPINTVSQICISIDTELVRKNIRDKRANHQYIGAYVQQSHMLSNSLGCIEAMHLKSIQVLMEPRVNMRI